MLRHTSSTNVSRQIVGVSNASYLVENEIGRGSQGSIFHVTPLLHQNQNNYILKTSQHQRVLKQEFHRIIDIDANFIAHRQQILAAAKHLHAKFSYEKINNDYQFNTIMYFFEGPTLSDFLNNYTERRQVSIKLLFEITKKLLLAYEQQFGKANLIHNDIKPSNIILRLDYTVPCVVYIKIIDVETATLIDPEQSDNPEATSTTTVLGGTEEFAAPEQYMLDKTNRKSDLFSFAIIFGLLWKFNREKLLRSKNNPYFEPSFESQDASLPDDIEKELIHAFESFGKLDFKERANLSDMIREIDRLEVKFAVSNALENCAGLEKEFAEELQAVHNLGAFVKAEITEELSKKTLKELRVAITRIIQLQDRISAVKLDKADFLFEFTKEMDVYLLRKYKSVEEWTRQFQAITSLFEKNIQSLLKLEEQITLFNPAEYQKYFPSFEKLLKKILKVNSIDEMNDFNQFYSEAIEALTSMINKDRDALNAIFTDEIRNVTSLDHVLRLYKKLTGYASILKSERGFFSIFNSEGITTTWGKLISELQGKALSFIRAELKNSTSAKLIQGSCDELFNERCYRISYSQYKLEFDDLLSQYNKKEFTG